MIPSFDDNSVVYGDAREVLRGLPSLSIDLVVTSPPYFDLRKYCDDPREIGQEKNVYAFINSLLSVFDAVHPKLKDEGSLWVNIGDTYRNGQPLMIPEEFCRMMYKTRGWYIINKTIWYKVDAMAESTQRRFSQKWEPFFWFVKDPKNYYFNAEAAKIPVKQSSVSRLEHKFNQGKSQDVSRMRGIVGDQSHKIEQYLQQGVNAGDVWALTTNKERVKHAAPYPVELCVRPIVACCPPNGNVFDPFAGSGTTGIATLRVGEGRKFLGTDINQESVEEANERLHPDKIQGSLF